MSNPAWVQDVPTFDWSELNGKRLLISVSSDIDSYANERTSVVLGLDEETGLFYTIHSEVKRIQ